LSRVLWAQINNEYREKSIELGLQAVSGALAKSPKMTPSDVDLLMTVFV